MNLNPECTAFLSSHQSIYQAWRQQLHQHPEIAFEEEQTADFVAQKLREFGLECHQGLAKTGVIGILRINCEINENPALCIGLRADLDALPIQEKNQIAYRSQNPGKMHACGHDGHVIMLLAAAHYLSQYPPFEKGIVYFIFQPAEENLAGGKLMVEEGLFEKYQMDSVYGLHNMPGIPFGHFAGRVGAQMASADFFDVVLEGIGGHAAWPHRCQDPITAACQLVNAWQHLVSRSIDPLDSAVLSVTRFNAGESDNAIPSAVHIRGTVRTLNESVRKHIELGMKQILDGICIAFQMKSQWKYEQKYAVTVNDAQAITLAFEAAHLVTQNPAQVDQNTKPLMGAEDFSWMLRAKKGAYLFLGVGENHTMLHHPEFDFNDQVLLIGVQYWISLVSCFFQK